MKTARVGGLVTGRRVVLALWLLAAYLFILYVAFRWGGSGVTRFPGSD